MQATFDLTDGKLKLTEILEERPADSQHWNEAQNRFQFIDRLLTECLGWATPDITVEEPDGGNGRIDYLLGLNKAVLEAKRETKRWNLLPKSKPNRLYKIRSQAEVCPNFKAAVLQVIPYCALKGAQVAVICNGPQLAVFLAFGQGQEPLDGYAFIFDGFSSYQKEFPLLWTLLSPEGISENRAQRRLLNRQNIRIPVKASNSISEPRSFRYRSNLQEELRELGSFLLEEIEDNPELRKEFYRNCYVTIEANNRNLLLSKQVITSRYSRVSPDGNRPAALDAAVKAGSISDQAFVGAGSRPIVVIGDVGVGKSSFFENLYLSLEEKERENTIYLTVDLGISATMSNDIKDHVIETIPQLIYDRYEIDIDDADFVEAIYHREIHRFDRGLEGRQKANDPSAYEAGKRAFLLSKVRNRGGHIRQALSHLAAGRKKRVILVIDNADQRTFEVQQDAFLIAQELAAMRTIHVFVAVRPSTFYLSKMSGALSAYQNKILTISPPPADEVIQRRLTFALRVAEGKTGHGALEGIRLNLTSIVLFLKALLRSVRSNERIQQFLGNITGGNTKSVIELITSFVGSPNVEAEKIVDLEQKNGEYIVPFHEFTKHALLGQYRYYNPESSLVACNIFDVSASDPREHFLRPLIVSYCNSSNGNRDNDGYFGGTDIAAEMARLNFGETQIREALKVLARKKLIETPYSHYRELNVDEDDDPFAFAYRATSVGVYHIRFWLGEFSYLDAMAIDTPIFENTARSIVTKLAPSFRISDRFAKSEVFRDYLVEYWQSSEISVNYFDFEAVLASRADEFDRVANIVDALDRRQ